MQDKTDALWKDPEFHIGATPMSSCSSRPDPEIKVVTKIEKTVVQPNHVFKTVQMNDIKIYVVIQAKTLKNPKEFEAKKWRRFCCCNKH